MTEAAKTIPMSEVYRRDKFEVAWVHSGRGAIQWDAVNNRFWPENAQHAWVGWCAAIRVLSLPTYNTSEAFDD